MKFIIRLFNLLLTVILLIPACLGFLAGVISTVTVIGYNAGREFGNALTGGPS